MVHDVLLKDPGLSVSGTDSRLRATDRVAAGGVARLARLPFSSRRPLPVWLQPFAEGLVLPEAFVGPSRLRPTTATLARLTLECHHAQGRGPAAASRGV